MKGYFIWGKTFSCFFCLASKPARGDFFFFFFNIATSCISSLEPCSSFCFEYKAYSKGTLVFRLGNKQGLKLPVVELAHLFGRESQNKH